MPSVDVDRVQEPELRVDAEVALEPAQVRERRLRAVAQPEERGVRAPLSALAHELGLRFLDHVDPDHQLVLRSTIFVDGFSRHLRAGRVQAVEVVLGNIRATLVLTGADALCASEWPGQGLLAPRRGRR